MRSKYKAKRRIGQVWTSRCGVDVTIIGLTEKDATLEDSEGNQKTITRKRVGLGFGWPFHSKGMYACCAGKTFLLDCGVFVTVTKYENYKKVHVTDSLGNIAVCGARSLTGNTLRWPFPHLENNLYRFKVGDSFRNARGYLLVVAELQYNVKYLVVDVEGNEKIFTGKELGLKQVTWPFVHSDHPHFPKGYYVYVAYTGTQPLYIGSGTVGRWKHVNSGASHSALVNQHFFTHGPFEITIHKDGLTKDEAVSLEYEMIAELLPKYNLMVNPEKFGSRATPGKYGALRKVPVIPFNEIVAQSVSNVQAVSA